MQKTQFLIPKKRAVITENDVIDTSLLSLKDMLAEVFKRTNGSKERFIEELKEANLYTKKYVAIRLYNLAKNTFNNSNNLKNESGN